MWLVVHGALHRHRRVLPRTLPASRRSSAASARAISHGTGGVVAEIAVLPRTGAASDKDFIGRSSFGAGWTKADTPAPPLPSGKSGMGTTTNWETDHMRRRTFLAAPRPRLWRCPRWDGQADKNVLKFIPQSDLAILDPVWTTAYVTRQPRLHGVRRHAVWTGGPEGRFRGHAADGSPATPSRATVRCGS